MRVTLNVWRQKDRRSEGRFVTYDAPDISADMSFLEMLDVVNQDLILKGEDPIAFDHDCREGICGMCSLMINGIAHGPKQAITTCQLHMRSFKDGDSLVIEPWRASAFPILKDLIVDRTSFERIIQSGGFISASTGSAPEANSIPVGKEDAEKDVLAKIAEMPKPDRVMAERLHAIVKDTAPELSPKTWYGMPAYAKDGKIVCFFQSAAKFKSRYATFGFSDTATLDDGAMWPTSFALRELGAAEERKIRALVRKAVR